MALSQMLSLTYLLFVVAVISAHSLVELLQGGTGGLSVLRTFRLLRVARAHLQDTASRGSICLPARRVGPLVNQSIASVHLTGVVVCLSVLRTFRLLRILKLVRFMPALRYQLVVMLRTMDNVAMFFALLILFIFIFR